MRVGYHIARLLFGAWFLFSGLWHFLWPWLQPMGTTPEAIAFTRAMLASGLFDWVKVIEVAAGVTVLLNRAMPATLLAVVPLNVVILYWNLVLDRGAVDWAFGIFTVVATAVLAWPWRAVFWPLFVWRGAADYSLAPRLPGRSAPPLP